MRILMTFSLLICLSATSSYGQEKTAIRMGTNLNQLSVAQEQTVPKPAFALEDGTPLRLRLTRNLSSADAKVNDTVDFEVLEEVKVGDVIVIDRGAIALGTVTEAQHKRSLGRAGKLNVNIDSVRLKSGDKVALRAIKDVSGGGHVGAMTGAMVATSIVFFPAAPLFLFIHGKDITIPKGTEITAYINGNIPLDQAKFIVKPQTNAQPVSASPQIGEATAEGKDSSTILIKSDPEGADIIVDGKYVGSTPSTLRLSNGDHNISVEKSGCKTWGRTITINLGSNITVNATLEKTQ